MIYLISEPDILGDFANALNRFQDTLEKEIQSLKSESSHYSDRQKDEFSKRFDTTCQLMSQSIEVGCNAIQQFNRYQEAAYKLLG